MTTTNIVVLFGVLVIASIGIILFVQARERNRLEQARRLTALEDAHSRMNRMLNELPPQFLTNELRLLIVDRAIELCGEMRALKSTMDIDTLLADDKSRRQQIIESAKGPAPKPLPIDNKETFDTAKHLLELLFRFVEARHKSGKLATSVARQHLKQILFFVHRAQADLLAHTANEHLQRKDFRKAIHCLNLACTELEKSKDNPEAVKAIKGYRQKIEELQQQALGKQPAAKRAEDTNRLDKEMESMLKDEDAWKKKADYDS
ncbi:hypothetical protein [Mangrovitalea sediminis]|uniref:hypothetical protein n=1 Tax=Mangrovitalea sediminis TaxID=1982043 RepID=UPI000BE54037|nr:hypothetical protein [Mangrovitalea sediminis]